MNQRLFIPELMMCCLFLQYICPTDVKRSHTNSDTDFAAEKFMTFIRVKSGILINHLMYFEVGFKFV